MTSKTDTRQAAIRALQARRRARGSADPLNRLRAHVTKAIADGEETVVEQREVKK